MRDILDVCSELKINGSVDFIGKGNIWINNTYDSSVIRFARFIIYEAVRRTAPGQLSILA